MELSSTSLPNHKDIVRPLANFPSDIWGDRFLTLPFTHTEFESCSRQVEVLKERVKEILMTSVDDPIENILVINSLYRLGVWYHFENEIETQLSHLFTTLPRLIAKTDYDLDIIATAFQVFRSNGYKMSSDVFSKFKNVGDGKFKEEVGSDIKGMISLYEASHWRMNGELILEEALSFKTSRLESIANQSSSSYLEDYIQRALHWPYHRSLQRVDAKHYISFYEKDESRNDVILKFAKLDFNRVQMLHQKELRLLTSWWKKLNVETRFPYARHRIVEFFFMAVEVFFEPHFALGRSIFTKWYVLMTLVDDSYDAYGIYEELQHFTKAIERFDISAMDELPIQYLKTLYETVLNIYNESMEEVSKEGRSYSVSYCREELKRLVQLYDVESQWTHKHVEMPTFEEYLENGKWSIALVPSLFLAMVGLEEADENAYQYVNNRQAKILEAVGIIWRLYDDIQTNEDEEKRAGQISGTACYMKQFGVSRKEAIEAFKEIIKVAWKDMNEAFMRPWPLPNRIMRLILNLARSVDITYKQDDGLTYPDMSYKHHIAKVLIDPIPIQD